MRVAIVGSRNWTAFSMVRLYVYSLPLDTEVISGGARGVDRMAELCARERNLKVTVFPADWTTGKGAGFARNSTIVANADKVVAFWDGTSNGTRDTIQKALNAPNVKEVLVIKR